MKRKVALALAAVVVAVSAAMGGTVPAKADVNPYITEGTHHVNGRDWRTTCEPYSQTTRCRTEIKATQVTEVGGRFVVKTGWYFNNLTYLPSPRALWVRNPLGFTGTFTGADGRKWSTSCDTAETGRNGCRTYAEARVIESRQVNGVWHYTWVTKSIFNNIVQFSAAPPVASTTVTMPDAKLRECINVSLRKPITSAIPLTVAATITDLECTESKVSNLTGLEQFKNLETLYLDVNQISNLTPLRGLTKLQDLSLASNAISDLTPLASLTGLVGLEVGDNKVVSVAALKSLVSMQYLSLEANEIADVTPLASLTALDSLFLAGNNVADLAPLAGLRKLTMLDVGDNRITSVSALSSLTQLDGLFLDFNTISDVTPLQGLTRLTALSMWGNEVVEVAPLAKLRQLSYLMLAENNIAKVAPLAAMPKLEIVGLWGNPVADRASLDPLIARGCEVWFDEPEWEDEPDGFTINQGPKLAEALGAHASS